MNSTRTINSIRNLLFLQYLRKARGQVTVAGIVKILLFTAIMTNHCSFRWKQYSPPVKADFLRDFRSLQQHPMLLSAYLKEPTPQSSAGSFSGFSTTAEIPSLSSKGFHNRNTLELQPSFRNSLLNTVYYCKPQSAILFYLPHPFWYIRAQSPDFQQL